jgi:hypothetical protein
MSDENPALILANKIEIHLKLDETPGYYLTNEDQRMIIDCLRFAGLTEFTRCDRCGASTAHAADVAMRALRS